MNRLHSETLRVYSLISFSLSSMRLCHLLTMIRTNPNATALNKVMEILIISPTVSIIILINQFKFVSKYIRVGLPRTFAGDFIYEGGKGFTRGAIRLNVPFIIISIHKMCICTSALSFINSFFQAIFIGDALKFFEAVI